MRSGVHLARGAGEVGAKRRERVIADFAGVERRLSSKPNAGQQAEIVPARGGHAQDRRGV